MTHSRSLPLRTALTLFAVLSTLLTLPATTAAAAPASVSPGSMIRLALAEWGCTIGFGGRDGAGTPIVVTARHCAAPTARSLAYLGLDTRPAGVVIHRSHQLDYLAVALSRRTPIRTEPVAPAPRIGDIVCKTGRISGRTCGPVTAVTATSVMAKVRVVYGDSGGPLRDQHGRLIGITSRAARADLPDDALAARTEFAASMAGVTDPVTALFVRVQAIISDLNRTIGFGPGRTFS